MAFTPRDDPATRVRSSEPLTRTGNEAVVVTTARLSKSADVSRRERRYLLTMLFRCLCFGGLFLVPMGWWQVGLLAGAALLPPIAVVLANAIDNRSMPAAVAYEEFHSPTALTSHQVIISEPSEQ